MLVRMRWNRVAMVSRPSSEPASKTSRFAHRRDGGDFVAELNGLGSGYSLSVQQFRSYGQAMHVSSDHLLGALRSDGLRITAARRAICDVLAELHDQHLSAADILEQASRTTPMDQSTVYRTIEVLEAKEMLTHTHVGHGALVYHLADEPAHQHLVCSRCGATTALAEADVAGFFDEVETKTGFVADPSHVALSGVCASCAAQG